MVMTWPRLDQLLSVTNKGLYFVIINNTKITNYEH